MLNRLLVGFVLVLGVAHASEFEKAKILEKVNVLGVRPDQVSLLHVAAQEVVAAKAEHKQAMDAQIQTEAALASVVANIAAGRPLTQEQKAAYEAAGARRQQINTRLNSRIEAAIDGVTSKLSVAQRMKIGVPNEVRQRSTAALQQIRGAQGRDWDRLRRDMVRHFTRRQMDSIRNQYRNRETANTRNENRQELRQQENQLEQWANSYLNRVRSGDAQALKDFEGNFVTNAMREGEAERAIEAAIREIVTAQFAVAALAEKVKAALELGAAHF